MISSFQRGVVPFTLLMTAYFAAWGASQTVMGVISVAFVWHYLRRRTRRNRSLASQLASPPVVSLIVPAYNEALTIVASVHALLALDYSAREVVVVNDGSTDETLHVLRETFQLLEAPLAFDQPLASEPVRRVYRSMRDPDLIVLDKHNGGSKSDALNAGINAASGMLVLVVDADTLLERDALSRAVLPFLEDRRTVAVGGAIAVANGCRVEGGRITAVSMPHSWLARFQVIEYMRSFLLFRTAMASMNAVTLVSGACGLFRRDSLIAVGGYDRTAVGEDIDLTVRLQEHYRQKGEPFRIAFDPFPLCSTQVPEDMASLRSQRFRWRRGLLQVLWRRRRMIGRKRYGIVGLVALPYTALFEGFGPILETAGYGVATAAALTGVLDWHHYRVFMVSALLIGAAITLLAVLLNDVISRRYLSGRDLVLLVFVAIVESLGYRQLNAWWSCVGTVQALAGRSGWGAMQRRALLLAAVVALAPAPAAGQEPVLIRARDAATHGRRGEALTMLETHLAASPRDVDARLLYGLVLSWDGRFDEARRALQEVLTQAPSYTDARIALMNVEFWSGRTTDADELARTILARDAGNQAARAMRDRIDATSRPWWAAATYRLDTFNDGADPWHETTIYVTRQLPIGPLIARGSHAERFGLNDQFIDVDFYPRLRIGTYAYLNAGVAPDPTLYPQYRVAFDLYQSIGRGFEVSGGARYTDFGTVTQMYVAGVSKYVGHWMLTGKVSRVPADNNLDSTTYQAGGRRYFGGAGTSFVGVWASHGLSQQEVRQVGDLLRLDARTVGGDLDVLFGARLRLFGNLVTSRSERIDRPPLWQTAVNLGLSMRF